METITVQRFDNIADDNYDGGVGEFAITKHFDILTYPGRLQPLRGMTAESVTDTKIGNIIVASDGLMYAIGTDPANPTKGKLWYRQGYGASDVWASIPTTNQLSGQNVEYPFLVEYKQCGNTKTMFWAANGNLLASDPAGGSSATTQALTFTNIGQGLVHPKDNILYIPYRNSTNTYVATISPDATPFNTKALTAFTIPSQYTIPCLSFYGNYLAIPGYSSSSNLGSIVYLSDRDTSQTTFAESINWGSGQLKVLNNLNGVLIGISTISANSNGSIQDYDSIQIKGYDGGTEPILIKEIQANHLASSSQPICTINPRVNFVYKNRLYFSINVNPNDGISNSYYGLWSIGKNKKTGRYSVTMERVATNNNSETGVIAAAMSGDFVCMAHTAEGTLTYTINGQTSASTYGATSVYESVVNPSMEDKHKILNKQLMAVGIHCFPLATGQIATLKYRVDSTGAWTTIVGKTSTTPDTKLTATESIKQGAFEFTSGRNYEFRMESTGGAIITGFSYKYKILPTNI